MQKEATTTPIAIDLGLPSGTLWADRNLGAESITDCGDYYMWGSTEPDTDKVCDWAHTPFNGGFRWHNPDVVETFRMEAFPDGNLSDQYDAAHVQLGGNWHIPTTEQAKELLDYTDSEWTIFGGILGRIFTSKSNGNAIFIPAAGFREGSSVYYVGSRAYLWSSTLNSRNQGNAYGLNFLLDSCFGYVTYRCDGFCIRPVLQRR